MINVLHFSLSHTKQQNWFRVTENEPSCTLAEKALFDEGKKEE